MRRDSKLVCTLLKIQFVMPILTTVGNVQKTFQRMYYLCLKWRDVSEKCDRFGLTLDSNSFALQSMGLYASSIDRDPSRRGNDVQLTRTRERFVTGT